MLGRLSPSNQLGKIGNKVSKPNENLKKFPITSVYT